MSEISAQLAIGDHTVDVKPQAFTVARDRTEKRWSVSSLSKSGKHIMTSDVASGAARFEFVPLEKGVTTDKSYTFSVPPGGSVKFQPYRTDQTDEAPKYKASENVTVAYNQTQGE